MNNLSTESSVTIDAPVGKVWEALTTPATIKKWFFGVDTITDWKVGSPIVHKGEWQGKPYEDRGNILKIEPRKLLRHTHWSAFSGLADAPQNYQQVTWALTPDDGKTDLTVLEVNIPSEKAKESSEKGWDTVLGKLKELLEE